jgi:hypothetical protein
MVLLLWFYLSGVAILLGAEFNSVLEDAAAKAGAPDAKEKGEKASGQPSPSRVSANWSWQHAQATSDAFAWC